MNVEITNHLSDDTLTQWQNLINSAGLVANECAERTVLVYDGERLVATGSRDGYVLKLIAVDGDYRGEDLTSTVITELRRDAFDEGHRHLFLYTKPQNRYTFESLFFYPVAETEGVLVMENKKDGIKEFLASLPKAPSADKVGGIIMNCNPFTLGHQYLIELAARECECVFVFVLSEQMGRFSAEDRLNMVKAGVAHLSNVTVLPTGPYLISAATFPTYFIKNRDLAKDAACEVDIEIFIKHFAKRLGITRRYLGTEPLSNLTARYNALIKERLSGTEIEVREVERLCEGGAPISASEVRSLIDEGNQDALVRLVPRTTLEYLKNKKYL